MWHYEESCSSSYPYSGAVAHNYIAINWHSRLSVLCIIYYNMSSCQHCTSAPCQLLTAKEHISRNSRHAKDIPVHHIHLCTRAVCGWRHYNHSRESHSVSLGTCFKMEDVLSGKKKLEQFKVAELRDLLEQRGLSKTGVKLDLVKRLKEVILLPKFFDDRVCVLARLVTGTCCLSTL